MSFTGQMFSSSPINNSIAKPDKLHLHSISHFKTTVYEATQFFFHRNSLMFIVHVVVYLCFYNNVCYFRNTLKSEHYIKTVTASKWDSKFC